VLVLRYTAPMHNEHALVAAFPKRSKRDRCREMLSNPRLRHSAKMGLVGCLVIVGRLSLASQMKQVNLPLSDGTTLGAAFSPDSSRIALITNVVGAETRQRHILQVIELKSNHEIGRTDILADEPANLSTNAHLIGFSSDGRYLLLATQGSDVLLILDSATLDIVHRISLHPNTDARTGLEPGHPNFRGIVSISCSAKGNVFGLLTHDELEGEEVFIGSFSSEQIVSSWNLGKGRMGTELGKVSLSLSDDGSEVVVSRLPDQDKLPKGFDNIRLFKTNSGNALKSIHTNGLVGQVVLFPKDEILAARIDTPGLFSKKACLERWNLNSGTLDNQFCDEGRNVSTALSAAVAADRVVGFGSVIHKTIEGSIYSAPGRVDVWDLNSGALIASSEDMRHFVPRLQISPDGEWVFAEQVLLQLNAPR
jgi:WD40 repeat protein